jgi:hypothetical protein
MTSNPEPHSNCHASVKTCPPMPPASAELQTAYAMDLTLFRRILTLSAPLRRPFFVTWASVRLIEPVGTPRVRA